jgi:drug/metabolite transporter (DMT)-like permease
MLELKNKTMAPLFLFLSALMWSTGGLFTKSVAWNGLCLATLRGVIALAVSAFLLRGRKIKLNRQRVLAGFCYFVQGVFFLCANKYTTAANAAVLQQTSPLNIILFNVLLAKKRPTKPESITCVCLFAGMALTFMGNLGGGGMLGNIFALISAWFFAGVFFLSKEEGAEPLESLLIGNAFYLFFVPFLVINETVHSTTPSEWAFLLVFASLSGIGAWLCFAVGIKHTSALQANFITMSEPVMAPVWTFLFLGERISALSVMGCVVVLGTLLIYNVYTVNKQPKTMEV